MKKLKSMKILIRKINTFSLVYFGKYFARKQSIYILRNTSAIWQIAFETG